MSDPFRRHKYAVNRILIPAARILSPEFNAAYLYFTGAHIELLRNLVDYANRRTTFVDEYHDGYYLSPDDTDWNLLQIIIAELEDMLMSTELSFYDAYVCLRDVKAEGTDGGSFTSGAWRTRDLNEELADTKGICTLSGNQITLNMGTYRCLVLCPGYRVNKNKARLYNISDSAALLYSQVGFVHQNEYAIGVAVIAGSFTLADTKTLEVQHQGSVTKATDGFGTAVGIEQEVYTIAEFWRQA